MRKFLSICLIVFCGIVANAQHLQFMGIPIDGSVEDFKTRLEQKGFTSLRKYGSDSSSVFFAVNGTYAGEKVEYLQLHFTPLSKTIYGVSITCVFDLIEYCDRFADFVIKTAETKYNTTAKRYSSPRDDGMILEFKEGSMFVGDTKGVAYTDNDTKTYGNIIRYVDKINNEKRIVEELEIAKRREADI